MTVLVGEEPEENRQSSSAAVPRRRRVRRSSRISSSSSLDLFDQFQALCDSASWETLRHLLATCEYHSLASLRFDSDTTALHLLCRNRPPLDILLALISVDAVRQTDASGWLPLHYASACGASLPVVQELVRAFPQSVAHADRRGRTPLHFALGGGEQREAGSELDVLRLLIGDGSVLFSADENGMLPLHYACAYGASEDALQILLLPRNRCDDCFNENSIDIDDENNENVNDTIAAKDHRGRTPLHLALVNADRHASPGTVKLLISQDPTIVNAMDHENNLPLHLLATRALAIDASKEYSDTIKKHKCLHCQLCLFSYLKANPRPTVDLLMALQILPPWLKDAAVVHPVVQTILNRKISMRFPTAVIFLDLFFNLLVITTFPQAVVESLDYRSADNYTDYNYANLIPLYLAVIYFAFRELVQAVSLTNKGRFQAWANDSTNWADMVYANLLLFWTICIQTKYLDYRSFQVGSAICLGVFWINILLFLKSILFGFAIFVGGVVYVVQRLAAFFLALLIILLAFAQMFFTLYRQSDQCPKGMSSDGYITEPNEASNVCDVNDRTTCITVELDYCEPVDNHPWCNFWTSFYKAYSMLLGEVDDDDFEKNTLATILFVIFMFGVVVVLANVLIAIVTDSYGVIQNERAAVVFWSNRLDFVAEMDVILESGFQRNQKSAKRNNDHFSSSNNHLDKVSSSDELWKKLMYQLERDRNSAKLRFHNIKHTTAGNTSSRTTAFQEIIIDTLQWVCVACFLIPLWLLVGILTFGILLPPQVREKLLTSKLTMSSYEEDGVMVEKEIGSNGSGNSLLGISRLRQDVASFHRDVMAEMNKARVDVDNLKTTLMGTKSKIDLEMAQLKKVGVELLEALSPN